MARARSRDRGVTNFGELHDRLARYRDNWIFRGHSDVAWKLVPKAGRDTFRGDDRKLFEDWKRDAVEFLPLRPNDDWDCLAIAQHHGLTTRLLDWTVNPLNAAFFALHGQMERPEEADRFAVIHAARFEDALRQSAEMSGRDPMTCESVSIFRPRGIVPRITRQGGLFTIHGPPTTSLEDLPAGSVLLEQIVIRPEYRATLLAELAFYGISSASLFPDLDGLSRFLNWSVDSGSPSFS